MLLLLLLLPGHSWLFNSFFPPSHPDVVQPAIPNPYYRVVHFDVSSVDLTNSTLVKAEFRIFRGPNPEARALEQRVELYQVSICATSGRPEPPLNLA